MLMELLSPLLARFGRTAFIGLLVVLMKGSYLRAPIKWETSYDYVIVGGGAAGCVLANRLSEDPSTSVLLLEAGPEENFLADIPIFQTYVRGSPLDWNFVSEPNRYSNLEADGQKMGLFQGKVLGGTTVINAMLYVRGSRYDYDSWQSLGADGWSYQSNLKYFIKSERNHVDSIRRSPYHGTKGPVDVNLPRYKPKLGVIFNEAGRMMGYRSRIDHNGPSAVGFAIPQSTMNEGRRISAATAYLDPIIGKRRNLRVITYTTVTRINLNDQNHATGVRLFSAKRNGYYTVHARKEVILSAGAISSPKLLMLSGIGDCDHLERVGIKCRINRPAVGMNLMDHIGAGSMVFLTNDSEITTSVRDINPRTALEYFTQKRGPLSSTLVDGLAFINTENGTSAHSPNVEFILGSASLLSDYGSTLQRSEHMSNRLWNEYRPYSGQDSFVIYPVLLTPKSRGRITLRSGDPFAHPKVDMNYLSCKEDVDTLVKGMKTVLKLVSQPPFQAIQSRLLPIRFLCPRASFSSHEYLRCALKSYTVSFWHFSGTAKMGQVDDQHSVVDTRLRVIGTSGLRVIDASVMPLVTTGHLQASVYMIAEKAADMIKGRI